ncbi:hypothetical protein [Vibrio viridaestus]|uniref:Chemotaxis protein n=1 Tax=Vibrio viridaestus TaxID=2487322 RepID=A0A3N9TVW0_9VIBR|nr:hypothetical protein [Vibrio viridaestus]RQW61032.1 hypothetical protein EES38_21525 [Vibrio viridaestus]
MGGKSSSSNSTTTNYKTTSGSVGIDGDNNGYVLAGVENSSVKVNVTDGGSVKAALAAMTDANSNVTSMAKTMVAANTDVSKYAIDASSDLGTKALVNAQQATTDAMDIMKNLSLNSDAGTAQEMTKYFMFGAVAIAVAVAVRGKL